MMLYRALHTIMPAFRGLFASHGLTEPQWRALRVLWETPEITVSELSTRTLVLAPSLVGVIDRLEAAGLVRRQRSPSDRRQVLVKLTTAGRKLESEVVPAVETIYQELRNAIAPDVYDELMRGLDALSRVAPLQQTQAQELSTHEPSK